MRPPFTNTQIKLLPFTLEIIGTPKFMEYEICKNVHLYNRYTYDF